MTHVLSLVSYQILPARTGGQRSIALFNKYLARHVNLTCVTTRSNQVAGTEGYPVLNILSDSPARYMNPFYFFTLRTIIHSRRVTHLLVEHPYYGWLAVLLKWFCGIKLVVRSQNIEGLRWKGLGKSWWNLLWYYERWVHRRADYNFFIQQDDLSYALRQFRLQPHRCTLITYGIETADIPSPDEKKQAKAFLQQQHAIPASHRILLFNGTFSYAPNLNALQRLLQTINPVLHERGDFPYTLLICGKDIPAIFSQQAFPNVIFAGFVEKVEQYFMGVDVFLNPVTEGGGIKTKLVEALSYNTNTVSAANGAIGVDPALCNGKLFLTPDDLTGFTEAIIQATHYQADLPFTFFRHFYWGYIAEKAAGFIK